MKAAVEENRLREPMRRPLPYKSWICASAWYRGPWCKLCTANPTAGLNPVQRMPGAVTPYGPLPSDGL